jgi:putative transposase
MKRQRHSEEQIIAILKEHETGMKTADLCRKHGISDATFYNWKAKYVGQQLLQLGVLALQALEPLRLGDLKPSLEAWRTDYNTERPHSRLGWMTPATYAAARRSAALRSTDGSAPRTAATTAQQGTADRQTPIGAG